MELGNTGRRCKVCVCSMAQAGIVLYRGQELLRTPDKARTMKSMSLGTMFPMEHETNAEHSGNLGNELLCSPTRTLIIMMLEVECLPNNLVVSNDEYVQCTRLQNCIGANPRCTSLVWIHCAHRWREAPSPDLQVRRKFLLGNLYAGKS